MRACLFDVVGVARHRRHRDLLRVVDDKGGGARRRRPIHRRSVLVPTASLANTWRNCLVGGAMPPKVSTSTSRVIRSAQIGCFHNQTVREECLIHRQRGWPHRGWPQAELPTGGGFEDTEPSAPAADRRRRARFGGWLSGTVSGRPACELSPRDDRRRSVQARRHARSRPTPRPDQAVRAGMMQAWVW